MRKLIHLIVLCVMILNLLSGVKAEPIDSLIWSLLKNKKPPIEFTYFIPGKWQNPSLECGIGNVGPNWTFPLVAGMKLTAFKEELFIYCNKDNELGKAKDLNWCLNIFAGYGMGFSGNWTEHFNPWYADSSIYPKVIEQLKKPYIRKAVWNFMEPALKYQVKSMPLKFQGIVVISYEYVSGYFKNYDIKKARNWYDQDTITNEFAYKDYRGNTNPSRKITALIERLMFKWNMIEYKNVMSWINIIGDWLKKTLGPDYNLSINYWRK
jgi:hypothetical protein